MIILDISKIEAGKMEVHLESFDLAAWFAILAQVMQPLVQRKTKPIGARLSSRAGHDARRPYQGAPMPP
jgi:signal transduction histidine kinase